MRYPKLLGLLACLPHLLGAQASSSSTPIDWVGDVRVLARELPRIHPNAFYRLERSRWDSAVQATERRIGSLTRNQATVALMELVALVHDGHTSINPFFNPAVSARYYPFQLHQFEDGVFIRSAPAAQSALVGAKVIRFGRVSVDSAMQAIARVIPHENEWWVRAWGPEWLGLAEVIDGLDLVDDPEALSLVVERNGRRETVVVRPAGPLQVGGHTGAPPIDRSGWTTMYDLASAPLWLRNQDRPYWVEWEPTNRTLYVSYRAVMSSEHGLGNEAFWRQVFAMADSLPLARLVLDIRENIGGNSFFNRQVTRGIVSRPALDRADRLFVITGARTFSAAMNLSRDLERWTNATFVGEPTGNARYFYGDHQLVPLPGSRLSVAVSTLTWPPYDPRDNGPFLAPAIFAPLTSDDFRRGVDPAMREILRLGTETPLDRRVEAAITAGDTAGARQLVLAAHSEVANRFRSPEAAINALGYRLLRNQQVAQAVAVFRLNTSVFPHSSNVWDSYGESLVAAGDSAGAIASYRRAVAIDPNNGSSLQALQRLGASPHQ
jgi:hypothetical protein